MKENFMASIKVELKSLNVPNFVIPVSKPGRKQDGFKPVEGIPIGDMDENTLSVLCDEFRRNVFIKAGKTDPKGEQ
jgi:hypothetical protein